MKKLIIGVTALLAATIAGVYAQTRSAEDGQSLQRELESKAVRVPAQISDQSIEEEGRADRAQFAPRLPDLAALREDLRRSREEDAQNQPAILSRPTGAPLPGIRALAADRLGNVESDEVDRVLIPVLLPAHQDVRDKLRVYGMSNVYTATADIDFNASLSISGTCNRVIGGDPRVVQFRKRLAENPPRLPGTGAAYFISRNDFGADLSFSKFGCGYVITIECDDPANDVRCSADDYISTMATAMILANPALAGGE